MTLDEQVFRKMGYVPCESEDGSGNIVNWHTPEIKQRVYIDDTPLIASRWEVAAKFLAPFMEAREYYYQIIPSDTIGSVLIPQKLYFMWKKEMHGFGAAEIKDHNLAEAACKSFLDVKL